MRKVTVVTEISAIVPDKDADGVRTELLTALNASVHRRGTAVHSFKARYDAAVMVHAKAHEEIEG